MAREITSFGDCVSAEELKQRFSVTLINGILWLVLAVLVVASMGGWLLIMGFGWLMQALFAEYNVRKIQALGVTVSPQQLPTVAAAVEAVCKRFNHTAPHRVIVIPSGEINAFAIKFARKRVVVILSEMLEGVIEHPAQLRALLGHELCHGAMDHGWRGVFELYKPAKYRQGRELTCDNAGLVAAGDLESAALLIKKLAIGRRLCKLLSEPAMIEEALQIYSGLTGWLLRQYLSHPPAGARVKNLRDAAHEFGITASAPASTAQPTVAR